MTPASGAGLDTSGHVQCLAPDQQPNETTGVWFWNDLSPFTQGYVEALFSDDIYHRDGIMIYDKRLPFHTRGWAFSDLASETLAQIIADCEACLDLEWLNYQNAVDDGRLFWTERQKRDLAKYNNTFLPMRATLGDDSKVRLTQ